MKNVSSVFWMVIAITFVAVLWGVFSPETLQNVTDQIQTYINHEEYIDELIFRTPGYHGWQQEYWLSHCGDFCAIVQYVGWKEIEHLEEELSEDIEEICSGGNVTKENLKQWLVNGGDLQGYLFQCVHCKKHRLHIDAS
nr:CbrC family protein [Bacillus xiamenensis]